MEYRSVSKSKNPKDLIDLTLSNTPVIDLTLSNTPVIDLTFLNTPEAGSGSYISPNTAFSTPQLQSMSRTKLQKIAKARGLKGYSKLKKDDLIELLRSRKQKSSPKSGKQEVSPKSSPKQKSKSPSPKETYIRKVGPPFLREKYGLISVLGSGKYGDTWKARNLDRQEGENKYYAVKILNEYMDIDDWKKEIECLVDVLDICTQIGILCYKDSFLLKNGNKKESRLRSLTSTERKLRGELVSLNEYVIITDLLEGYQTLSSFMYDKNTMKPYPLSEKDAFDIYQKVVDVKNALTELCINHSDLHFENIMIHPQTKDIKVIDLGRCQTPQEEIAEWSYIGSKAWKDYSDEARLLQLRRVLYNAVKNNYHINLNHPNGEQDKFFSSIKINPSIKNCSRKQSNRDLLPRI